MAADKGKNHAGNGNSRLPAKGERIGVRCRQTGMGGAEQLTHPGGSRVQAATPAPGVPVWYRCCPPNITGDINPTLATSILLPGPVPGPGLFISFPPPVFLHTIIVSCSFL